MKEDSEEYRRAILEKVKQEPIYLDTDEDMWEKVMDRVSQNKSKNRHYRLWYASAAAILICLSALLSVFWMSNNDREPKTISDNTEVARPSEIKAGDEIKPTGKIIDTGKNIQKESSDKKIANSNTGTVKTVVSGRDILEHKLSEGSEFTLNSDAKIAIQKNSKSEILLSLSGEAYFEVIPDKKRAFKVYFGDSYLQVVGTKFNIRNIQGEACQEISVSEGIVRVYPKGDKKGIDVKRGELLKIPFNEGDAQLLQIDPLPYISWKTGILYFNAASLEEVGAMLTRIYKTKVITDSGIKSCTFTGDLSQMPLNEALQIIEAATSFKIEREKNNVYISGSRCN